MSLRLLEPTALPLLLLLGLVLLWSRHSLAGLSPLRRRVAIGLRLLLLALILLALARPEFHGESEGVAVAFVLDASDSIPESPTALRASMREALARLSSADRRAPDDQTAVLYFGAEPACEWPPESGPPPLRRETLVDGTGTNIAAAVNLAANLLPAGRRRRIVLMTDGNETAGNGLEAVRGARRSGVRVDILPLRYRHPREIALTRAILPETIRPETPFRITATAESTHACAAEVSVRRGERLLHRERVELHAGSNHLPLVLREPSGAAGLRQYEVTLEPLEPEDDHLVANNRTHAVARIAGPPSILYIDGNLGLNPAYHPRLHAALVSGLKLATTDGRPALALASRETIPASEALSAYDAIILDNVPAEALGLRRMQEIRALVHDQGVGLLMIGGEQSFGAGNYLRTPVELALPVEMELRNKKQTPNGALAIILHTCEFADGNAWAKRVTGAAIDTLGERDLVGVLYWGFDAAGTNLSNGHRWLFPLQPAANRTALKRLVEGCDPGDMPDFDTCLAMAVKALQTAPATIKHVIIISDGDPSPPSPEVQEAVRADKTLTLSAVAIGPHSTPATLQRLATEVGGGAFYNVDDPRRLPRIFVHESLVVRRSLLFEEPFVPRWQTPFAPLQGLTETPLPALGGYVCTTARPEAAVILTSANENRDPILAHWRYGLGQALAFTSDAKNRWGERWLDWPEYERFWGRLVSAILRDQPTGGRLDAAIAEGRGKLRVQPLTPEGDPISEATLVAHVTDPELGSLPPVRLRQTGIGLYEGSFPARTSGLYQVAVQSEAGEAITLYGAAAENASAEIARLAHDETHLARLAEAGGGLLIEAAALADYSPYRPEELPSTEEYRPLWNLLLFIAACLLPLDVLVRRVMIGREEMRTLLARLRPRRPLPDERSTPLSSTPSADAPAAPLSTTQRLLRAKAEPRERHPNDSQDHPPQ